MLPAGNPGFVVRELYFHSEQRGRKGLALRIGHQRQRAATAQTFMQKEIERAQIWQFESLNFSLTDSAEVLFDARCSHFPDQQRIGLIFQRDQTDVRSIALIPGTGVGNFD